MRGSAKRASETLGALLEAVYQWEEKVDAYMATGDDDSDVVVTHDARGRLIELSIRPGLQEELTVDELNDAVCAEVAKNADRAHEGLMAISREFLANFADTPQEIANHPVATEMAKALNAAQ
jgi:uncharacterized coiled-coil protein SlyX